MAKSCNEVWLATDEDREGEAISWHLCQVLNLEETSAKRIVFHEITKPAILKAVQNPRLINRSLVDAQQARRILDRLVGFKVSPILWRKISSGSSLSAGRVQSVAVRLIVERSEEIDQFELSSNFQINAFFKLKDETGKTVLFKADLSKKLEDRLAAKVFLESCKNANYSITDIQVREGKKTPPPPFTTSTLQQEASRKLGFSVSRTMVVAQKLYEAGKITYMRTDSTNLSKTARNAAAAEIVKNYGDHYLKTRIFKTKQDLAQEAHEAIRPTYFEQPESGSSDDQKRLYRLIWRRAVASQMSDALLERTTAKILISTNQETLQAKGEVLKFDGFLKLYRVSAIDEESEEEDDSGMLPPLHVGQDLDLKAINATERFSRPPALYNEASLVKKLEELGIGRPSTYAPTISTIQNRKYVLKETREGVLRNYEFLSLKGATEKRANEIVEETKEETTGAAKNKLFPTDTGKVVNRFLMKHFDTVFDYGFTAQIEKQFDEIAKGEKEWQLMIDDFYQPFQKTVADTMENAERETGERVLGTDPKSGKPVVARLGRYGAMIQIGSVEDEEKPKFATLRSPLSIETVTFEQAMEFFKLPRVVGQFEQKDMVAAEGRFGPYIRHNSKFYSIKKDDPAPLVITAEEAIELIKAKREADAKKLILDFEEHEIQVLNGRYGPYIKAGKKNVKITKDKDPLTLTLEECQELAANTPDKPSRRKAAAKNPAAKKTTAAAKKTTAAKKPAAKKTTATKKKEEE